MYEVVNFCEFDPMAVKSYCAIHGVPESKNLGDITLVDEKSLSPFNMICGGSPCQDFSVAGKLSGSKWVCKECGEEYNPLYVHYTKRDKCPKCGGSNIDKTRSSLLVEWLRIVRANKPSWGIYENVKNLVGKQFKETTFKLFLDELIEYGYNVYWKVLNAKNYGIPQNRERVYLILIKKELDNGKFVFPEPFDNGLRLKDLLENTVDEKFYLTESAKKTYARDFGSKGKELDLSSISPTLVASMGTGGGNIPYLDTRKADATGGEITVVGRINFSQDGVVVDANGISPTPTAWHGNSPKIVEGVRVRKLIPLECWRLMGFADIDFNKAKAAGVSNSQLYKQAGNSIVVDVLYYIYSEVYKAMPYLFEDLKVGSYFSGIGAFEKALDRLYEEIIIE